MNTEQKASGLRRLLRDCPDVLTPRKVASWTHQSKNTVYALIHSGALPAYPYRGGFQFAGAVNMRIDICGRGRHLK